MPRVNTRTRTSSDRDAAINANEVMMLMTKGMSPFSPNDEGTDASHPTAARPHSPGLRIPVFELQILRATFPLKQVRFTQEVEAEPSSTAHISNESGYPRPPSHLSLLPLPQPLFGSGFVGSSVSQEIIADGLVRNPPFETASRRAFPRGTSTLQDGIQQVS